MSILNAFKLKSNRNIKINFDGGTLSSDSGLFLLKEFIHKIGFMQVIKKIFHTKDDAAFRIHSDADNLMQMVYQIVAGYFADDRADDLALEPVITTCLDKSRLASQPTVSRFFNRMGENTLDQFNRINKEARKEVYSMQGRPNTVLFDFDSTLLETYGSQEGSKWNYHYKSEGYHPLLCYDGLTGDLLRAQLRDGTDYSSKGVGEFAEPLFREFTEDYPYTNILVRGDSGFATPELYDLCEKYGAQYAIRLKENSVLLKLAKDIEMNLFADTKYNQAGYAVTYGEFMYQAGSWKHPRRVACKIEKPKDTFLHNYTFVVTALKSSPEDVIDYYCKRGNMENFIKECKNDFNFSAVSSSSRIVNANRLQVHVLAYNLVNWMRRLVFPESMKKDRMDTIRLKLIKIASRIVHHSGNVTFKLCSSCAWQREFMLIMDNIQRLSPIIV